MDDPRGDTTAEVTLTLLLAGGHSRSVRIARDSPLLRSLLAAIEDKADGGKRVTRPYHLHIDDGRQSLIFAASDLVGLTFDPPMALNPPRPTAAGTPPLILKPPGSGEHPSRFRLVENFLDPALHAELLAVALSQEPRFADASVSTNDADYRRSKVLYEFPKFSQIFRERVGALAPQLMRDFEIAPFPVADVECQMTAHNDGNYFRLHNDSGSPDTATRVISYVYYFHNEPKGFTGGAFRLFHSRIVSGTYACGDHAVDIEPRENSILFFPSYCHHEVLKVSCPSGRFADGRFTVNGWVRRAA